jgi:hypothetical protein
MIVKLRTFSILITIAMISGCGIIIKPHSDKLIDGWYLPSKSETKNIRHMTKWTGKYYYLDNSPLISFTDIDSVSVELWTEPDSSIEVIFKLTSQAQNRYNETVTNMEREELVFLLNDSLINFRMIYSDVQRKEPLSLMLGYSDHNQIEIDKIIKEIREKLNK